jgi:hypothetical protein
VITFVFSVTEHRDKWQPISVVLDRRIVEQWQRADGRTLRPVDLYAIAKMSLFERFDAAPENVNDSPIHPNIGDISRHLQALGLL